MAKVMVVGASGMFGAMAERVLSKAGHDVLSVHRSSLGFDAESAAGADALRRFDHYDAVVNCVAITRLSARDANTLRSVTAVNSIFPWHLAEISGEAGARLIHISSDAVFRGASTPLFENDRCDADDVYGLSKRLGEPISANTLSIRCSIIGPELTPRGHLLEWFLSHADGSTVEGHTDRNWCGVTTLQLARFCGRLVEGALFDDLRARAPVVHFSPNWEISKHDLLREINRVYERAIDVRPVISGRPIQRILKSQSVDLIGVQSPMRFSEALVELRAAGSFHDTSEGLI